MSSLLLSMFDSLAWLLLCLTLVWVASREWLSPKIGRQLMPNVQALDLPCQGVGPDSQILLKWQEVSHHARQVLKQQGIEISPQFPYPYKTMEGLLKETRLLANKDVKLYRDLRILRNKIAHAPDFYADQATADDFCKIADGLVNQFELLVNK